jgi:hypothetical protein
MLDERETKEQLERTARRCRRSEGWCNRLLGGLVGFTLGIGFDILIGPGAHH